MKSYKTYIANFLLVLFGISIALVIVEFVARKIDDRQSLKFIGKGGAYMQDDTLGFVLSPGTMETISSEFHTYDSVNADFMNDEPIELTNNVSKTRILGIGDSHTYAIGVSRDETWPNLLEKKLFKDRSAGTVYNGGSIGYSLGQYLLKYRKLRLKTKPNIVIVGFSMATDLYDLLPPRLGGFLYGSEYGRVYFDLNEKDELIQCNDLIGKRLGDTITNRAYNNQRFIDWLHENCATFKLLKRSKFAMWVATHLNPTGKPLWPGMETAVKADLKPNSVPSYSWKLAERLIEQLNNEITADSAKMILVNIPYTAVVYDDLWNNSFGSLGSEYERFACSDRLGLICKSNNIQFIDLTKPFIDRVRSNGVWLHHPIDAHPNKLGQEFIADLIIKQLNL